MLEYEHFMTFKAELVKFEISLNLKKLRDPSPALVRICFSTLVLQDRSEKLKLIGDDSTQRKFSRKIIKFAKLAMEKLNSIQM